ncbi:MAG: sulfatase [Planctomycetota bacterium]
MRHATIASWPMLPREVRSIAGWLLLATAVACRGAAAGPNVLFIAVDDLRPELGCYGSRTASSPHIDALAASGVRFDRGYCQFALCNPSRSSLLSGRRPETLGVVTLARFFRDGNPGIVTLPEHFRLHGYESRSYGKIFHVTNGNHDDPPSWSAPPWPERKPRPAAATGGRIVDETADHSHEDPWGAPDCGDDDLIDGKIAARAVAALGELRDRPFFLAVGFHKPHLPFVAPKRYWDRHDSASFAPPADDRLPESAPAFASNDSSELRRYQGIPASGPPVTAAESRRLIHGYHACVTYVDAQVGRVLAELDRLGLADRTVVVLWGDHGYHLGEKATWTKRTNWETATRVPLIVRAPGLESVGAQPAHTGAIVELLDIYPTLVDLCGLPRPEGLEGRSLRPLLENPKAHWDGVARSMIAKTVAEPGDEPITGRAVRTPRWRWIEWTGPPLAEPVHELYAHQADPAETRTLAGTPEGKQAIAELRSRHPAAAVNR